MDSKNNQGSQIWGGRFKSAQSEIMYKINSSIDFDKRLYKEDIIGSIAHANMLAKQKIITHEEKEKILAGLKQIQVEIENNRFDFDIKLEDIHMNIEAKLKEMIGDVAKKLHTARSRNDQVATDFKLFTKAACLDIEQKLKTLNATLITKAEENIETYAPGFTHLQTAQPISFAHHLMAYVEMFKRDIKRINNAINLLDECPLGACALAGTSFPIDRDYTAKYLGFNSPTNNSIDSVSDRDFVLDFLSNAAICAMHISRFAEEIVIWMSRGFNFIDLPDELTTGSSIMPQKKNPDAAELIRAKSGRINGNLINLLTVLKGLALTYSKDMQEDKEPLFDSYNSLKLSIVTLTAMISAMQINKEQMLYHSSLGFSTATDLADYLVQKFNIAFREAHQITGNIVALAESKKCKLEDLPLEDLQKINKNITKDIYQCLTVEYSVNSRKSFGGTSTIRIKEQIIRYKKENMKVNMKENNK